MYELLLIFGLFFAIRGAVIAAAAIFHECSRFGANNIGRKYHEKLNESLSPVLADAGRRLGK